MIHRRPNLALLILALAASPTFAAPDAQPPATAPATAPATTQRERQVLVVPPRFQVIEAAGRRIVCEPIDADWVRAAAADITPTTRPTTMPTDLLQKLVASREKLTAQMQADLAMTDTAAIAKFLDEKLIANLRKLDELKPSIYFMVVS